MSHFLSSIHVWNFRSIREASASLSKLSPLVGQNNAGKSNLLSAIQWLIAPSALESRHFREVTKGIMVEATVEGITEVLLKDSLYAKHAERIRPRLIGESLRIRRVVQAGQMKSKDAVLEVFDPKENKWDGNPAGIDNALTNLFPEPVCIDAMVDAPEDVAKNKTTTTLGKLIAQLTKPIAEQHGAKLKAALKQFDDLMSADGSSRPPELATFDHDATETLQTFFPGLSLVLDFPSPQLPELLKSGTVKVKEGESGEKRDFTSLGHGAQRSIQMALVQLLAKRMLGATSSPRCTLLLIDEPELFLHPQAIEQVRLSLRKLSESGYQVIFSTHTPLMLGRTEITATNIVTKPTDEIGTIINKRAQEAVRDAFAGDEVKQAKTLFALSNAKEVLFARRVLLVEGHTEAELLPAVYEAVVGRPLVADKLGIVRMSSCGDLCKALRILENMGIEALALADLDYAFVTAVQAGVVDKNDARRMSAKAWFDANKDTTIVLSDDGWPTKKSEGGAEGAFRKMASDKANSAQIQALHEELKAKRVWIWKLGSFEHIVGLANKNDDHAMDEFREALQAGRIKVAEHGDCKAFFDWLKEPSSVKGEMPAALRPQN